MAISDCSKSNEGVWSADLEIIGLKPGQQTDPMCKGKKKERSPFIFFTI